MKDFLFCLVGPSGSGKTTIAYELQKKYGYNVIESYTTRPPRYEGEKGHIFVDDGIEDAWNFFPWLGGKALPGNIIAYNDYNGYEYWATREQYQGKGVSLYIVDVPGIKMLKQTVKDTKIITIALYADYATRLHRLVYRSANHDPQYPTKNTYEDKIKEAEQRLKYDHEAFAVIPCDYVVNTNDNIHTVVKRVNRVIQDEAGALL